MNSIIIDLALSGIVYIILTYLTIVLMRKQKKGSNDDDGGSFQTSPPSIDLPPGVTWPSDDLEKKEKKRELVY